RESERAALASRTGPLAARPSGTTTSDGLALLLELPEPLSALAHELVHARRRKSEQRAVPGGLAHLRQIGRHLGADRLRDHRHDASADRERERNELRWYALADDLTAPRDDGRQHDRHDLRSQDLGDQHFQHGYALFTRPRVLSRCARAGRSSRAPGSRQL